jgi:radical SAM superfamily enzyme YgiQ (UPF0313 family)
MNRKLDLLIIAPSARKLYQKLADNFSAKEPNIWAGLLANAVRSAGYGVIIYDMEIEQPDENEFADMIIDLDPRLILFVVTGQNPNASTAAMSGAVESAKWIKDREPQYLVAFVGPHINALPKETLSDHPFIDIGLTNEGVYSLLEILSTDFSPESLKNVNGICYRDTDGNLFITSPSIIVPQDRLEFDLPGVAYDLMPSLDKYRTSSWHANYHDEQKSPFASIYTSLGCIYQCEFCMINIINRTDNDPNVASANFNKFRYWNPEFTIKQLDYLADQGVKQLKIADEMWVLNPKHFMTLCDLIIERQYNFNIWAYTRIDTIKPKYLEKLKAAGVNWLAPGIEAGNQEIRREITKGKFEDINIRKVIKMIKNADINVGANYIFGLGHDTWETMQETLNLALELNTENANMYCATALPGSPLYLKAKSEAWDLPKTYEEYGFLAYEHLPSRTYSLTPQEVLGFRDYAFHVYFENPKFLNMIFNKFGEPAIDNIRRMTKIKLKRKLLGD